MITLGEIANLFNGVELLADWLGEGGTPVTVPQAAARAAVCEHCPENREGKWWERMLKDPIANVIVSQLALKHQLNLHLPNEEKLFMCRKCGCCLRLKPWVPIAHIAEHTDAEMRLKFPDYCWIKKELTDEEAKTKTS